MDLIQMLLPPTFRLARHPVYLPLGITNNPITTEPAILGSVWEEAVLPRPQINRLLKIPKWPIFHRDPLLNLEGRSHPEAQEVKVLIMALIFRLYWKSFSLKKMILV